MYQGRKGVGTNTGSNLAILEVKCSGLLGRVEALIELKVRFEV